MHDGIEKRRELLGVIAVVHVQEHDDVRPAVGVKRFQGRQARGAIAAALFANDGRAMPERDFRGLVGRTVVDDNDLISARRQVRQYPAQRRLLIERGMMTAT
jgi:hypothetical protein